MIPRPDLVVVVAGTPWDGTRFPEHHVARHLAKRAVVLWVDPPVSPLTRSRSRAARREPRLRAAAPGIMRLSPVTVPGVSRPGLRRIAQRQARRTVREAVSYLELPVRATIVASLADMLDVVPARCRLFYGTDDFAAGAELMGIDPAWAHRRTTEQLIKADVVVACSQVIADRWSPLRDDIEVVPNGCDFERLEGSSEAPRPADVELPGPIAGFAGGLSDRIDIELLAAVADTGVSLLLVGPRQPTFAIARLDALLERPNVQWVGAKPFERMPEYLGAMDVGLTPYTRSAFNEASCPLKTLDYLAAGLPVVATDLPSHRALETEHVRLAVTPAAFAEAVVAELARGPDAAAASERRAVGARSSWPARAEEIAGLIGLGDRQRKVAA